MTSRAAKEMGHCAAVEERGGNGRELCVLRALRVLSFSIISTASHSSPSSSLSI